MASIYKRGQIYWIKFYRAGSSNPCRESLGQIDPAQAQLIRRRFELEQELCAPALREVFLPEHLRAIVGTPLFAPASESSQGISMAPCLPSVTAQEVISEYLAYIEVQNTKHHARNKKTHLKRFFGAKAVGLDDDKQVGVFKGTLLCEVRAADIQTMIDGLAGGKKTKRHYRNTFHALFEFALKRGHFASTNFRYPNPMSALPTYHDRNKPIVYLTQAQIDHLLEILKPVPTVHIAVAVMIYAGLRRAEMLWLRKENISPDLRFISVVNKTDEETDIESSLKTGERSVPIVPALKPILEEYLKGIKSDWLVPSPTGLQWLGENFGDKHRNLLRAAELEHKLAYVRGFPSPLSSSCMKRMSSSCAAVV